MTEAFLHFIWKFQLFESQPLKSSVGQEITILKTGTHNTNAGPDFLNSKVKIGNETWVGNVEIHLKSSDWNAHNHQNDEAYKNVILHVVFIHDEDISLHTKGDLPVLDLSDYIGMSYINKYERLIKSRSAIPCSANFHQVDEFSWSNWLDRLVVERLERKTKIISFELEKLNNNWNETFYRFLAKNFGFKVNAEAFLQLAESLPSTILEKHKDSVFQIEALLFGQAGLLDDDFEESYPFDLANEYAFLKKKYNLFPRKSSSWKYLRLMPANFPPIRISQFANLFCNSKFLFSRLLECVHFDEVDKILDIKANDYWSNHSAFERETKASTKKLGKSSKENILINTLVPFLFLYGKTKKQQVYVDRALRFLEECPSENNAITRKWDKLLKENIDEKMKINNALQSQGSLELKNEYCLPKKCLSCSLGIRILNK